MARLDDYDLGKFFNYKVGLFFSTAARGLTSSEGLIDVWLQPPDIWLSDNSEPCLEDAKGDGEAVEQVIWEQEKSVDHQEPEVRAGQENRKQVQIRKIQILIIVRFHVMITKEKVPEGVVVEVLGTQSCWFKVVVGKLQETKFIKF